MLAADVTSVVDMTMVAVAVMIRKKELVEMIVLRESISANNCYSSGCGCDHFSGTLCPEGCGCDD